MSYSNPQLFVIMKMVDRLVKQCKTKLLLKGLKNGNSRSNVCCDFDPAN